jgi:hypothetical protein
MSLETVLQGQLRALSRMLPLCPDHRDKQTGKTCLACRIEKLERCVKQLVRYSASGVDPKLIRVRAEEVIGEFSDDYC